jgi:hypothetical protein
MMLRMRHNAMAAGCFMNRNPFCPVTHFDAAGSFLDPYVLAGVSPRHRVSTALPRYIGIARHTPQFVISVWIRGAVADRL